MISLCNEYLYLAVNEQGCITHLENLKTGCGNVIADPKPLFRLTLHTGTNYEDMAFGENQQYDVTLDGNRIVVKVDQVTTRMGAARVAVEMTLSLDKDHVNFGASVKNDSQSTVAELFYPCVGAMKTLDGGRMDLLWPRQLGEKVVDVETVLRGMTGRESLYQIRETYPGPLSMSWCALTGGRQCLYFASYDELLHVAALRARGAREGGVTLELTKMCFVRPGETWEAPRAVTRLYAGSWREGADEYAAWASSWRRQVDVQDWVKKMNGYFLVINKQQYGDEMWPYETLPELYEYAQAHGYDALGLFGWYHTGHDNNYPDLEVSPTMGGAEGLKKGIEAVHEKGGHVTLYYQGHLIDINSPFYQEKGKELEGRTIYNNPYYEFYPKACSSDFARSFSRRVFSTVCPSCEEWHELMARRVDWVASFGADGALYDQIGGMPPYPCFNEKHHHMNNKPSLSYTQGRLKLHNAIQKKVKSHPNFAFLSEHVTDAYSQFLDCIHGIGSHPSARDGGIEAGPGQRNRVAGKGWHMMPQLFRYTFPESMCTVRNPHPYMDERMVNYAIAFGCKFEMELRYLTDQIDIRRDAEPEKRKYAKAMADLRRKYEDYLLLGVFRAEEGILNEDSAIISTVFKAKDGRKAIVLWNDTDSARPVQIALEGMKAIRYETLRHHGAGIPRQLEANEIAIIEAEDEH